MRGLLFALLFTSVMSPGQAADAPRAQTVVSADGISIAYEVHGQGSPTLVLVHGWSCDRSYWKEQIEYLAAQYQLVLIDLAGHGESGTGRKNYTMASFGADVVAVVDKLALERVVLVGHSMGGDVVVEAALALPDRVAGIVWVDAYQSLDAPRVPEAGNFLLGLSKDFRGTTNAFVRDLFRADADPKLVGRVATDMASAPPSVAVSAMQNTLANEAAIPTVLASLKVPVVALNADLAPTDNDSLGRRGVKVFVMPDTGHFPMLEDPARFNRSLDSVVKGFAR
jgi:pimeloyl-ACP methyl ester carboxylesterase